MHTTQSIVLRRSVSLRVVKLLIEQAGHVFPAVAIVERRQVITPVIDRIPSPQTIEQVTSDCTIH